MRKSILLMVAVCSIGFAGQEVPSTKTTSPATQTGPLKWTTGKYDVAVRFVTNTDVDGYKGRGEEEMKYCLTVQRTELDNLKAEVRFNFLKLVVEPPSSATHGTEKPDGEDGHSAESIRKAMIGVGFEVELGSDGGIVSVVGTDEVLKKAGEARGSNWGDRIKAQSTLQVVEAIRPVLFILPAEPIREGLSWKRKGLAGVLAVESSYKVTKVLDTSEGRIATIQVTERASADTPIGRTQDEERRTKTASVKEEAQASGAVEINIDTGMVKSKEMHKNSKRSFRSEEGRTSSTAETDIDISVLVSPAK